MDAFAREMGVSRATLYNWFERDTPPPSKKYQSEMVRLLREPAEYLFQGLTPSSNKTGHLKSGGERALTVQEDAAKFGTVASRLGPSDSRLPTRADCELLFQQILDAAEQSGDPSAFPVLMHRLKKQFSLDEFEPAQE